jgi:hypothetical protein
MGMDRLFFFISGLFAPQKEPRADFNYGSEGKPWQYLAD